MKKLISVLFLLTVSVFIAGCNAIQSGVPDLPEDTQETSSDDSVTRVAENIVKKLASQHHEPFSLSDDFIQKHLNMDSFEELKARTKAGIQATQDTADMTEAQFQLWQDITETEMLNQYTVADLEIKEKELTAILNQMAADAEMSMEGFMERYGMDQEQASVFIEKQAKKYVQKTAGEAESELPASQKGQE